MGLSVRVAVYQLAAVSRGEAPVRDDGPRGITVQPAGE